VTVVNEPYCMDYGLDIRGSIPGKRKMFLLHSVQTGSRTHAASFQLWALSAGVKRPWSEAYHSPPFSVQYKNCGAISPLLSTSSWRGA
jgi:hypothetical protein